LQLQHPEKKRVSQGKRQSQRIVVVGVNRETNAPTDAAAVTLGRLENVNSRDYPKIGFDFSVAIHFGKHGPLLVQPPTAEVAFESLHVTKSSAAEVASDQGVRCKLERTPLGFLGLEAAHPRTASLQVVGDPEFQRAKKFQTFKIILVHSTTSQMARLGTAIVSTEDHTAVVVDNFLAQIMDTQIHGPTLKRKKSLLTTDAAAAAVFFFLFLPFPSSSFFFFLLFLSSLQAPSA